jgi:DNA-binding CsgD family transcriptional regulator
MHDSIVFDQPNEPLSALISREVEVLERTSGGGTNAQVADELGIKVHAVKFHLSSLFRKLGVKNRTETAALYLRNAPPQSD